MSEISGLTQQLKKAGYRLTHARRAVIKILEAKPEHLSHQQILEQGRTIYPRLSRATVYRTIDLFVKLKLIRPVYLNEPTQRFVSAAGGHHHLVCTSCHAIFEFAECTVEPLAQELAESFSFQIRGHLLEFHGLCKTCR
jgi:Fur family transcriptional regulator, ferric uptake regulator